LDKKKDKLCVLCVSVVKYLFYKDRIFYMALKKAWIQKESPWLGIPGAKG